MALHPHEEPSGELALPLYEDREGRALVHLGERRFQPGVAGTGLAVVNTVPEPLRAAAVL